MDAFHLMRIGFEVEQVPLIILGEVYQFVPRRAHAKVPRYTVFAEFVVGIVERLAPVTIVALEERQQYDFSWLEQAVLLHRRGERAQALDIVYDAVDDLLSEGEFKQVNSLLNEVYVENLPSELLLGLLLAIPAKKETII